MSDAALQTLSTRLCPWLWEPLARLESARQSERLGHAWLIRGPAGVGKLNLALVFANRLLSGTVDAPEPLDSQAAASAMRERRVPADHHPDLHLVFPEEDKRTIGIEQIRDLSEALSLKGYRGDAKVAIIEPAEWMTPAAANALLKTLEEPAERTYILLIAHQPDRLLPTIRSRCQSLTIAPPAEAEVADWLGLEGPAASAVLTVAGRAPVRAAGFVEGNKSKFLHELENKVSLVSRRKLDPRSVAEQWQREDAELALEWLARRLERAIRQRAATPADSKAITSGAEDPLHNAWLALPTRTLFEHLGTVEKLLAQLGSGINVELALHALLLGLSVERGRT